MNWENFEKCWRNEGEINLKRLGFLMFLNGVTEENPYKVLQLLYKNIGEENILKRRVKGEDLFSINSNKTKLANWILFEKEWSESGWLSSYQIRSLIVKYKLKATFSEVYKRFHRRISTKVEGGYTLFKLDSGFDNQDVESGVERFREDVTGIDIGELK